MKAERMESSTTTIPSRSIAGMSLLNHVQAHKLITVDNYQGNKRQINDKAITFDDPQVSSPKQIADYFNK